MQYVHHAALFVRRDFSSACSQVDEGLAASHSKISRFSFLVFLVAVSTTKVEVTPKNNTVALRAVETWHERACLCQCNSFVFGFLVAGAPTAAAAVLGPPPAVLCLVFPVNYEKKRTTNAYRQRCQSVPQREYLHTSTQGSTRTTNCSYRQSWSKSQVSLRRPKQVRLGLFTHSAVPGSHMISWRGAEAGAKNKNKNYS